MRARLPHSDEREGSAHPAAIEVIAGPDDVVRVGDRFSITVRVACTEGCKPETLHLEIDPPVATRRNFEIDRTGKTTIDLVAGPRPGMQQWTFRLRPRQGTNGPHEATSLTWQHEVAPHRATLAVWAIPDAAIAREHFNLKIGANSTAGPVLAGTGIEIRDAKGETVARAQLGADPWSGTSALQWCDVRATAPPQPGIAFWTAHISVNGLDLAHEAMPLGFTVNIAPPPEHAIDVSVIEAVTGTPLEDALVRIGPFRATTNSDGRATLHVTKGRADVVVWKTGYDALDQPVEIDADMSVTITATAVPEDDPDAHWKA